MGDINYMRFSTAEFKYRCDRAKELMAQANLKGLFITEGGNFTYFTGGTRDFSFSRPTILLLPREGDPIVLIQHFPQENRKREIWLKDIRVYETMLGLPLDMTVQAMNDAGMGSGRVGAELGYEQRFGISLNDFSRLKQLVPKVEFADAADVLWGVRMIKSEEEIKRHHRASQITAKAYEALWSNCYEGMSEIEVVDKFVRLQLTLGGSNPWAFINSGPENYFLTGGGPSSRRIQKGNLVWIDGGCTYREYGSDFCASATVGPPSDEQKRLQDIVVRITKTLVEAVRPGIRACDLDTLNSQEWRRFGYDYAKLNFGGGRIGHGMGWGSSLTEPPHIAAYDKTVLRQGMVFTIEPGFSTGDGCFQAEEDLVVTENGCEVLSLFEGGRGLQMIPW